MIVKQIHDQSAWDNFVEDSPDSTIFHVWDFLRIVEKHSGYRLLPYGIYQGNNLLALFPVFFRKDLMVKIVTTSPPQTGIPYLGPILTAETRAMKPSTRESLLHKIVESVIAEINQLSPNFTFIQMLPMQNDIRPFKWNNFQEESNFTYFIDIDRPREEILDSFDRNARRLIRDAGKSSPEIRQLPEVELFYDIMQKRYAEQGLSLPVSGPDYLRELLEAFPANLRMYTLYCGGEISALVIVTVYKGRMTYWMGNAKLTGSVGGNEYLIWECIQKAKADGCREFEINGAGERRLCQFKSKFNPRLEVCYVVSRKDGLGTMAEWAYTNFKKKIWA